MLQSVDVDRGCFACMLGGPDGKTLFIAAAEWRGFEQMISDARTGQDSVPERAFWQLVDLLGLERQARHADLMAGRQRLRDVHPALYAAYMTSR